MSIQAFIGIGANLGDARLTVLCAIKALNALPHSQVSAQSSLFITTPIDSSGGDYINAVIQLTTELDAISLFAHLKTLESKAGRERPYKNAPRTLDLDLLLFGDETINTANLIVPHPRMTERAFVLIPLLQIAPSITILGKGEARQFTSAVADQGIQEIT